MLVKRKARVSLLLSNAHFWSLTQYFHRVLNDFHAVVTLVSADQILWCDHSNETSSVVLSHGRLCFVCSSNFIKLHTIYDQSNQKSSATWL